MLERILQTLRIACGHRNLSKPFAASVGTTTARSDDWDSVNTSGNGSYVVCLDCGKRFAYDWDRMRVVR